MESGKAKAIQAGVRIGAAAASGWLSTVLGPEAGPAVAETISEAGVAAVGFLGDRKSERVSRTLIEISDEAATRIAAGEEVRTEIADPESDDATALFEAVIEAAAQSIEDRKCAVIANVYASISFDPSITIADALLYIERIRACSWRQLVALQFLQAGDRAQERERIVAAGQEGNIDIAPALSEPGRVSRRLQNQDLVLGNGDSPEPCHARGSTPRSCLTEARAWSLSPAGRSPT